MIYYYLLLFDITRYWIYHSCCDHHWL